MPRTCFLISPIGDEGSAVRRRADQILKYVVAPSIGELGYSEAVRADQIAAPGMITTQIIQRVVESDLVIADLTGGNPNVFYELAIRHVTRKPLIQMIERGTALPFDVAAARTILVDHTDLDSVASAREQLQSQIAALQADPNGGDNPISVALDLQLLRASGNPVERTLADLVSEVGNLSSEVRATRGDVRILDRLKAWEKIQSDLAAIQNNLDSGIYDIDDVVDKLDDIAMKLPD